MREAREAVGLAVQAIDAALGQRGQWPGWVVVENAPQDSRRDLAAPLTALGMLCLSGVPGSESVLSRSRQHLELTVLPGGVWRYYANIPWDADDSAMCALALGLRDPVTESSRESLRGTIGADGLFRTWVEPGWQPATDAVANAHVVAVLGSEEHTAAAIAWLDGLVRHGDEVAACCFYPDALDTHMAILRAVEAGVEDLRPALELAAPQAHARLVDDLPAYRLAQSLRICAGVGVMDERVRTAATRLLAMQGPDGMWQAHSLFTVASSMPYGGAVHYTSAAVTTALCASALSAVFWEAP